MCDGIFSKEPARRRGSCGRNGRRICAIPPLRLEYAGNAPRCCPVRGEALECRVERGNMMKRMIAVFGVIAVLQAPAVERRVMEGSSFSMAGCRVSQLGEEEVLPEAVSEVRGAIAGWVEKDFRRKSLPPACRTRVRYRPGERDDCHRMGAAAPDTGLCISRKEFSFSGGT